MGIKSAEASLIFRHDPGQRNRQISPSQNMQRKIWTGKANSKGTVLDLIFENSCIPAAIAPKAAVDVPANSIVPPSNKRLQVDSLHYREGPKIM